MGDAEHTEPATTHTAREQAALEKRVHVDLPRVRPEDMVTTQDVDESTIEVLRPAAPGPPRRPRHRQRVHAAQRRLVTSSLDGCPGIRGDFGVR